MKQSKMIAGSFFLVFFLLQPVWAHFGMVIPSDNMVMTSDKRQIDLKLSFSHPFEGIGMDLVKPAQFFANKAGEKTNLIDQIIPDMVMNHPAWACTYSIKRPGAYVFTMVPEPYWEPSEDLFIIHYTKTVVAAFGDDAGWDAEIGLATEIVPLSKPFGLYAGNVFQGIVKIEGKPVPYAEIEVEYYNEDKKAQAPTDYMITQTIKADGNGVFTYAVPVDGWWGFAALSEAKEKIQYQGQDKFVEQGAVIWVKFEKWQAE